MNYRPSEEHSGLTLDFDRLVLRSPLPTLVSFENPWSKALIPGLDQLATAFKGRLRLIRVNPATHPALAAQLKIRVVPTLLLFKGGALVEFMVGPVSQQFVVERVANAHLSRTHVLRGTRRSRGCKLPRQAAGSVPSSQPIATLVAQF
jgi:thioredoxin 1